MHVIGNRYKQNACSCFGGLVLDDVSGDSYASIAVQQ